MKYTDNTNKNGDFYLVLHPYAADNTILVGSFIVFDVFCGALRTTAILAIPPTAGDQTPHYGLLLIGTTVTDQAPALGLGRNFCAPVIPKAWCRKLVCQLGGLQRGNLFFRTVASAAVGSCATAAL